MADGRHFKNSFLFISQPWILRFRSNLVCGCGYLRHEDTLWQKVEILLIQDVGRTPYWNCFWLYPGAILADWCEIWNGYQPSKFIHNFISYVEYNTKTRNALVWAVVCAAVTACLAIICCHVRCRMKLVAAFFFLLLSTTIISVRSGGK